MAINNNPLFQLDPEKILARLHIIACQNIIKKNNDIQIYNSGIQNMQHIASSNFDKVGFDVYGNKTGIYELGIEFKNVNISKNNFKKEYKKIFDNAMTQLHTYLVHFADYHKAKNLNSNDIYVFYMKNSIDMKNINYTKNYTIPVDADFDETNEKNINSENLCFKIKYQLDNTVM